MCRPEPPRRCLRAARRPALLLLLGLTIGGCGKGELQARASAPAERARSRPPPPRRLAPVAIPLRLDASLAARLADSVNLTPADVTGSTIEPRSKSPELEREASRCGAGGSIPVGGGRSPKLDRGAGLEHETISSSVVVLPSVGSAEADLSYASSDAGLKCYSKVLRKSLEGEASAGVHVARVRLRRMQLPGPGPGAGPSTGIRIAARVSSSSSRLSVPLYIDAVGFLYGPVEIELYATSFVQPEPQRTEQELLTLLDRRAQLSRL